MADKPFNDDSPWGVDLRPDPAWEEAKQRLWLMTSNERRAAMHAGRLTLRLCFHWANHAPHEVPVLNGEWWFIAAQTPEVADISQPTAVAPKDPPCQT